MTTHFTWNRKPRCIIPDGKGLVDSKLSRGQTVAVEDNDEPSGKVIDFMDALKWYVAGGAQDKTERKEKNTSSKIVAGAPPRKSR